MNICSPALCFGVSIEKNKSVFLERTQHSIGVLSAVVGICVCFLMGIYFCSEEMCGPECQQNVGPEGYWELWNSAAHPGTGQYA